MNPSFKSHFLALCLTAVACSPALAHKGSDGYLDVRDIEPPTQTATRPGGSGGVGEKFQWTQFMLSVAIKDLDLVAPLDANADGRVTWGELKAAQPEVLALLNAQANLQPTTNPTTPCNIDWQPDGVERRSDGAYLRVKAQTACAADQPMALRYTLLRDQDASHRLLVTGHLGGKDLLTTLSPQQMTPLVLSRSPVNLALDSPGGTVAGTPTPSPQSNRWSALQDYFLLGVHHLLEGYDHLAFLLALVLPLQLRLPAARLLRFPQRLLRFVRGPLAPPLQLRFGPDSTTFGPLGGVGRSDRASLSKSAPADSDTDSAPIWWALLRTITAFTVGHSITLMLATFGWTQASPGWVEPVIALSIGVTALLNLYPVKWVRTDVLALSFGMVHGFGFAGLLQEAAAPTGLLPWALAGFNLGVEAGQLLAVSAWVMASQLVVGRSWYPTVVVRGGSVLLTLMAAWWVWQRVL